MPGRRKRSDIQADINALRSDQRVMFDRAVSDGERPSDGRIADLAGEWMTYIRRSMASVLVVVVVAVPLLILAVLVFVLDEMPWMMALVSGLTATGFVGAMTWAVAYRPIRRREARIKGEVEPSRTPDAWIGGLVIGWILAAILGGAVRLTGVEVPAVVGFPFWLLIAWGCKNVLEERMENEW